MKIIYKCAIYSKDKTDVIIKSQSMFKTVTVFVFLRLTGCLTTEMYLLLFIIIIFVNVFFSCLSGKGYLTVDDGLIRSEMK